MVFSWHHLYCSRARFSSFIVLPVDRKLKCFKIRSGIACFPFSFLLVLFLLFFSFSLVLMHIYKQMCVCIVCISYLNGIIWCGSVAHMCTTIIGNEINKLIDTCTSLKVFAIVRWHYIVKSS